MALSKRKLRSMLKKDLVFASLVDLHGEPVATVDCREGGHENEICMEGNCVNGKKLVMRCNKSNGCDRWDVVPC